MKFKELYPAIAERHPERCHGQGRKVNPFNMEWLIEIQCDLEEIAINRDGVWHLKHTASARYDRRELYERVWAQPMQRIAKEYGVSDVALARACKRRSVPVPGVGYWASSWEASAGAATIATRANKRFQTRSLTQTFPAE
ncbi:MAG: hypothetical protein WA213_02720 [Terriglobales bacterium]